MPEGSEVPDQTGIPEKSDRPESTMSTHLVLQTPLNEEKSLKRKLRLFSLIME